MKPLLVVVGARRAVPLLVLIGIIIFLAGCVRLKGGAFLAKKGKEGELPQVKEVYFDSNGLLPGSQETPGKIET